MLAVISECLSARGILIRQTQTKLISTGQTLKMNQEVREKVTCIVV